MAEDIEAQFDCWIFPRPRACEQIYCATARIVGAFADLGGVHRVRLGGHLFEGKMRKIGPLLGVLHRHGG